MNANTDDGGQVGSCNRKLVHAFHLPPCRICGDKASGYHYGANTCESCKVFFRRSLNRRSTYRCVSGSGNCNISFTNRSSCQFCRYKRCLSSGMSLKGIRHGRYTQATREMNFMEVQQLKYEGVVDLRGTYPHQATPDQKESNNSSSSNFCPSSNVSVPELPCQDKEMPDSSSQFLSIDALNTFKCVPFSETNVSDMSMVDKNPSSFQLDLSLLLPERKMDDAFPYLNFPKINLTNELNNPHYTVSTCMLSDVSENGSFTEKENDANFSKKNAVTEPIEIFSSTKLSRGNDSFQDHWMSDNPKYSYDEDKMLPLVSVRSYSGQSEWIDKKLVRSNSEPFLTGTTTVVVSESPEQFSVPSSSSELNSSNIEYDDDESIRMSSVMNSIMKEILQCLLTSDNQYMTSLRAVAANMTLFLQWFSRGIEQWKRSANGLSLSTSSSDFFDSSLPQQLEPLPSTDDDLDTCLIFLLRLFECSIGQSMVLCEDIPEFLQLSVSDQALLLKSNLMQTWFLLTFSFFDLETESFYYHKHSCPLRELLGLWESADILEYLKFVRTLQSIALDRTNFRIVLVLILFTYDDVQDQLENVSQVKHLRDFIMAELMSNLGESCFDDRVCNLYMVLSYLKAFSGYCYKYIRDCLMEAESVSVRFHACDEKSEKELSVEMPLSGYQ